MKRQHLYVLILAIGLSGSSKTAMAQGESGWWGLGAGVGVNSIYGDLKNTGYGLGVEGYLTRRFNSHIGLTGVVGYSRLPFTTKIPGLKTSANYTTNVVRGDLMFDYEFASSSIRPYIGLGLGGISYQLTGKAIGTSKLPPGTKLTNKKRSSEFDFGPSVGFRLVLGPRAALDLGGSFRYTTNDNLDITRARKSKVKDAIVAVRIGVTTFFSGGGSPGGIDILASEQAPVEEAESDDLADFQQRIDQMESAPQQQPQDMQEYVRLKSRMDDLNQQIGQKEGEINTLRTALTEKNETVESLQTQLTSPPASSSTSFSRAYEEALSQFYAKRYTAAINQFNTLIAQFPDHSLASNCVYWIGESYFGSGNYRDAVNTFNRVLSYPRSLKKDDALLMLGRAHLQLNQRDEARQAFDRLIKEFPTSEFVAKAEEWLSRM
jgi:tol-pal system protein YbgF